MLSSELSPFILAKRSLLRNGGIAEHFRHRRTPGPYVEAQARVGARLPQASRRPGMRPTSPMLSARRAWLGPGSTGSVILSSSAGEWRVSQDRLGRVPATPGGDGFRIANGWVKGPESQGDGRITFIPDEGERASIDLSDLAMGRGNCGSSEGLLSPNTLATSWPCPGRPEAWIVTFDEIPDADPGLE